MTTSNPIPCPISELELLAYRDGELAGPRQAALSEHIAACPSCQTRLAQADLVTRTLTLGSPLRDQPVARAALHDRIAGDRGGWWPRRALIGAALPVAVLLLVVIGFNRWLRDDECASCPPPPTPMQVTAMSGLPAGWSSLLPCPTGPGANRLPMASARAGASARPLSAPALDEQATRPMRARGGNRPNQSVLPSRASRQAATGDNACAAANLARQPGVSTGPELSGVWSTNQPGS